MSDKSGSLYVIRHGRTEWNLIKKLQGQTDIPLDDEGIRMAKEAHDLYMDVNFDRCFCSPLTRARETAQLLLEGRDIPIEYDDRLKEINFGDYEGLEYMTLPEGHPVRSAFFDPAGYVPSGGESITDVMGRTGDFLNEKVYPLIEQGSDVIVVGHGLMNSTIILNALKLPVSKLWDEGIENCVLKKLI